jgi:hypothetical protein
MMIMLGAVATFWMISCVFVAIFTTIKEYMTLIAKQLTVKLFKRVQ